MKKVLNLIILASLLLLSSCIESAEKEEIELPGNDISSFSETEGDKIPVSTVVAPYSDVGGHIEAFSKYEKEKDEFPLTFRTSLLKTHQFIFTFDGIYPVDEIHFANGNMDKVSIDYAIDGKSFKRLFTDYPLLEDDNIIPLDGVRANAIRFVFNTDKHHTIKDIYFTLALGMITKERPDWFNAFYGYNGWTGADGIFSFNLDGSSQLGNDSKKAFIFSDTLIGEVYEHNNLRKTMVMINNSIGYHDPSADLADSMSFDWHVEPNGAPKSTFYPDSYIGKQLRNLLDSDGLSIGYSPDGLLQKSADGTQYLAEGNTSEIIVDFKSVVHINELYIWNHNDEASLGATSYQLLISDDNQTYMEVSSDSLELSSGHDDAPYTKVVSVDGHARFVKLLIQNDQLNIGLGKLLFTNEQNQPLYGEISGTESTIELTYLDSTARLWLQDGVVIGDYLYIYPILVKDIPGLFKVHSVGLIQVPITNNQLDYQSAIYHSTPLQLQTSDEGTIFYGAGIMNHTVHDGYIYVYGYKDLNGRHLIAGRFKQEDILNFNQYEYWNGTEYVNDIRASAPIINGVSAELSVTYLEEGLFAGKYMLVVMENTTSGKVSYALSDNPHGPFSDYVQIYQTNEGSYLNSAFTYNAKMQASISSPGRYIITYNVNAQNLTALQNALIYYPRFLELIEVKRKDNT